MYTVKIMKKRFFSKLYFLHWDKNTISLNHKNVLFHSRDIFSTHTKNLWLFLNKKVTSDCILYENVELIDISDNITEFISCHFSDITYPFEDELEYKCLIYSKNKKCLN